MADTFDLVLRGGHVIDSRNGVDGRIGVVGRPELGPAFEEDTLRGVDCDT